MPLRPVLTRRDLLHRGVGVGAFLLPGLVASGGRGAVSPPRRVAKSVIFLLLEGGMSHLESWDLKPDAPAEIRGEFSEISTTNPELKIGEHMPRLAKQAHQYNIIRSVHSAARNHSPGLHWILTGYDNPRASVNGETANQIPSTGSIVSHQLGSVTDSGLPRFVAIPSKRQLGGRVGYLGASHLGAAYEAVDSGPVPGSATAHFEVPAGLILPKEVTPARLAERRSLAERFKRLRQLRDHAIGQSEMSQFQEQAFQLLLDGRGQTAFDLNQEPERVRRRYGNHAMGQGTLLARRLVETGVTFVVVNYSKNNSWDTHNKNFSRLKNQLLPPMDQAVSALIEDLEQRGLLDETLVVLMGEMGRTPKINNKGGRDHWPDVYSVLMAGGGLTRGQLLGSSDRHGASPDNRPVHVNEVLATMYHQLGINPHQVTYDRQNRPLPILPHAHPSSPVRELIARSG